MCANMNELTNEFNMLCTLSDALRAEAVTPMAKKKVALWANSALNAILTAKGVADSLKNEGFPGVARALRQVDLKDDDQKIIAKSFTFWNYDSNCWHVLLEGPQETHWENFHGGKIGRG